nr:MAG TPA: hypothetical protein [Caudoviricetes sp.]
MKNQTIKYAPFGVLFQYIKHLIPHILYPR